MHWRRDWGCGFLVEVFGDGECDVVKFELC